MKEQKNDFENRLKKKAVRLAYWSGAYVVTMAIATFGPKFVWDYNSIATTLAILLNAIAGIGMVLENIRYLKAQDELMQRIQLEAMGLALGFGVVGGLSYSLLDITNLFNINAEIGIMVIIMSVIYMLGMLIGHVRYK